MTGTAQAVVLKETAMPAITIEALPPHTFTARGQSYQAHRGSTTYYLIEDFPTGSVCVIQVYGERQRRLPDGKVRNELLTALAAHKATPLRERLCTSMTVGQAAIAASTVL